MQEPFDDSHHEIAYDYDEYTVSLVEELTLATSEVFLSNNSDSMGLRLRHLNLITMDQRSRFLNKNWL
jgi:hypothetical protein